MLRKITFKGSPLTLVGRVLKIGAIASDFKVTAQDLKEASLSDFKDKVKVLTSFPSLDTPVCDLQVKEFNKKAIEISNEVVIVGISKDLPFAQQRFCESFEIKNIKVLSDYKTSSFGINYGLLIKELNLLARAVIILDKHNAVRYIQIVEELTTPPNYQDVLSQLEGILKNPVLAVKEELPSHCKPCEGGVSALAKEKVDRLLALHRGWLLVEDKKIAKEFKFKDFIEAKYFLDLISIIAEEQGHHPNLSLIYNKLRVTLTTHAAGGLTENDFIMAKIIDELGDD
ncbi:MAG: thiol peroxidase [Candidatus Omnitrophica bacterium]|nr:thiol peroxidase [Candidatus Omnitrophota bacterium]